MAGRMQEEHRLMVVKGGEGTGVVGNWASGSSALKVGARGSESWR
jgi:hypothetical protein